MGDREKIEERLVTLETRLAFQDETIETLNSVVKDQWAEIDRLQRMLSRFDGRLAEIEDNIEIAPPQKPPHY
ncbi:SlyX family protein [Gimibacter soli]|uniref:Protein SlyX homolog n=1 Tax=Gimibacter soli TaxID=3024400 RepID=A0AAF0BM08_9PROT|nr:SlyX family protein [Gimibacter soli]WCL54842.1 SlyX family protein [Gimibacter soli]